MISFVCPICVQNQCRETKLDKHWTCLWFEVNPYNVRERIKVNVVVIIILITEESLSFLELSIGFHLEHHKINPKIPNPRTRKVTPSLWNLPWSPASLQPNHTKNIGVKKINFLFIKKKRPRRRSRKPRSEKRWKKVWSCDGAIVEVNY